MCIEFVFARMRLQWYSLQSDMFLEYNSDFRTQISWHGFPAIGYMSCSRFCCPVRTSSLFQSFFVAIVVSVEAVCITRDTGISDLIQRRELSGEAPTEHDKVHTLLVRGRSSPDFHSNDNQEIEQTTTKCVCCVWF